MRNCATVGTWRDGRDLKSDASLPERPVAQVHRQRRVHHADPTAMRRRGKENWGLFKWSLY